MNVEHRGTIDQIDHLASKLVRSGKPDSARVLICNILEKHPSFEFERFDMLISTIFEIGDRVQADWFAAWLRSGSHVLCEALNDCLGRARDSDSLVKIDFTHYDLRDIECSFLSRKIVGFFFLRPRLMAHLLIALIRAAPAAEIQAIESLLSDVVLLNYSGVVSEFLTPISQDRSDKACFVAARCLASLDAYVTGLKSVGRLKELAMSERERQLLWQRRSDMMTKSFQEARKQSVLASLFTESVMLYGRSSVTYIYDRKEAPRRLEIPLQAHSRSFEMPRIDTVDPVGLQHLLISLRNEEPPL